MPYYKRALEVYKKIVGYTIPAMPQILSTMASCSNHVAFWGDVPEKNWEDAEKHYIQAIDLFKKAENKIETANAELNLQTMYQLSSQKVDLSRVKELTGILEKAGDKRAEKGRKILEGCSDQGADN